MCVVCYVIPVALHLMIYWSPEGYSSLPAERPSDLLEEALHVSGNGEENDTDLGKASADGPFRNWLCNFSTELAIPICVLVIGVGFSIAALWVSVASIRSQ